MSDFQKFLDENLSSIRINEDDAGTDTHESNTVTVSLVHVGLDFT